MEQQVVEQQAGDEPDGDDSLGLTISDFGPISRGTVDMKPLTVLVGPNGCGKSHVATLIHSIINSECLPKDLLDYSKKTSFDMALLDEAERILDAHKAGSDLVDSAICEIYGDRTLRVLYDMLAANFPGGHKNLTRSGAKHFELDIKSKVIEGHIRCGDTISADATNKMRLNVQFKESASLDDLKAGRRMQRNGNTINLDVHHFPDAAIDVSIIIPSMTVCLLSAYPPRNRSVYFPAERGGLTLANKSLMLSFYSSIGATHANSLDSELTNVSTQFLSLLLESDENRTEFAPIVEDFEERALHGSVITRKNPNKFLTLAFQKDGKTFPLAKSASSIKELAVFLFYLRCVAQKGETVVLEEPETALYPHNQILLARLVARLVNAGLNIIITTHSPYFLEQLSHCVVAGSSDTGKKFREFPDEERLDRNKVAAYGFQEYNGGYEIIPIQVDDEGIPQSDFVAASEGQYNELISLET